MKTRIVLLTGGVVFGLFCVGIVVFAPGYLPWSDKQSPETVTKEEFSQLLNQAAHRHRHRHQASPESDTPDAGTSRETNDKKGSIRERLVDWNQTFDTGVKDRLNDLEVVRTAPASGKVSFSLSSLSGDTRSLADYANQWRIINFWASWCAPCREEMPSLNRLDKHFKNQKLRVIAVNIGESRATVKQFVKQHALEMTVLLDQSGSVAARYGTFTLPETWIIDPYGDVVGVVRGPRNWNAPGVRTLFKKLVSSGDSDGTK